MPSTAMVSGILLILLGIIGYVFGMMHNAASLTALIPAAFGLALLSLGAAARQKESLRMHLMHAAVLIALFGFLIPAWRVLSTISNFVMSTAIVSQLAMALICLTFVILSINSFINARRSRTA